MDKAIYRPILRFKRGEQTALSYLSGTAKSAIKPLVNITPHSFDPISPEGLDDVFDQRLAQDAGRLNSIWAGYEAAVDLGDIDSNAQCVQAAHPVRYFFNCIYGDEVRANINPVLRFNSDDDYIAAVASVCRDFNIAPVLRLTPDDLAEPETETVISKMLGECGVSSQETEMVVDMGYITTKGRSQIMAKGALSAVPFVEDWATLSLVAGSFPESLSDFIVGRHTIERREWPVWLSNRNVAGREVIYGDYATIHPIPVEDGLDPKTMNPSASVRYTHEHTWLLLRGYGVRSRDGAGFTQFVSHANTLVGSPEYRGKDFSFGDAKIMRISQGEDKQGNLETWVTIGVNHHISEVVYQLANLGES